nr:importin-5-like [Ipomoea trifida]
MPLLLRSALENELPFLVSVDSPIITLPKIIIPALVEALEIAKTWAPDNDEIIGSIWKVFSAWFDRKEERENAEKYSLEPVNEEIQEENNVCSKASVLLPFELNEQKDTTPEERIMAFDIFHFIAEEFREQGLRPYAKYIPFLFEACRDTVPDIQQIGARAIGIYVEFDRETFKQHLQDGLSSMEFILQQTDEHMAKEVVICAYGKVCFFLCGEEINLYEITPKVLQVWARILCAVLNSRLIVKCKPFCCDSVRQGFLSTMEQLGLELQRVDLLPLILLNHDHMQAYSLMDIR